jgi:hypothetical protein
MERIRAHAEFLAGAGLADPAALERGIEALSAASSIE